MSSAFLMARPQMPPETIDEHLPLFGYEQRVQPDGQSKK